MQTLFIGIDGGGTKTDVVCADNQGQVLGTGQSGPTNLTSTNVGAASFNLKEAVRQSLQSVTEEYEIDTAAMGLAGIDIEEEYNQAFTAFREILSQFGVKKFTLYHDSQIALANAAARANAVVLISGTGSACLGRNDQGETAKAGGMDYLLTDQGSGYDIGRHTLREAVKSYDGRRSKTMLEEMVRKHFGIDSLNKLKLRLYQPAISKVEVAELAQVCDQAFQKGDAAAKQIFYWAQEELMLLVQAVVRKLQLDQKAFDLVMTGSILGLSHVREPLVSRLQSIYPLMNVIMPNQPAVYGALKLALEDGKHVQEDPPTPA